MNALADLAAVLRDADPADKTEIYTQLGLKLTYQPEERTVRAEARLSQTPHWYSEGVRRGSPPESQYALTTVFALGGRS